MKLLSNQQISDSKMSPKKLAYIAYTDIFSKKANVVNILNMCQALKRAGVDVTLMVPRYEKDQKLHREIFHKFGLHEIFPINHLPKIGLFLKKIDLGSSLFILTALLFAKFGNFRFCYTRIPFCAYLADLLGMKSILEMHSPPMTKSDVLAFRQIVRRQQNFKIIVISEKLALIIQNDFGLPIEQMLICHDAVDMSSFNISESEQKAVRTLLQVEPDTCVVTYSGSLGKGRGIELIATLSSNFSNAFFLVLGGEDRLVAEYREVYRKISNLCFFGHIPHREIPKFLSSSDILLMPYDKVINEPGEINTADYCSPMKLFEYLASGKPFVAANLPSLTEVLENEKNCLLAEPGIYEDWAEEVGLLLKDQELRSNLSKGASQTALSHTWEARVTKIINFAFADNHADT